MEWTAVRDGIGEVVGVPAAVRKAFSRRRSDIEAALGEPGHASPRAAFRPSMGT